MTKLSLNTHRCKSTRESTTSRSPTNATSRVATKLSARCLTWSGTRESIPVKNRLSASTATRSSPVDQTSSSTCKSTRRMTEGATSNASSTGKWPLRLCYVDKYCIDAKRVTCTKAASRSTTWSATRTFTKKSSTRNKVSAFHSLLTLIIVESCGFTLNEENADVDQP